MIEHIQSQWILLGIIYYQTLQHSNTFVIKNWIVYISYNSADSYTIIIIMVRWLHRQQTVRHQVLWSVSVLWKCTSIPTQETRVQSQVESYQKLKKWYLIPPYLTISIIWYESRVKWNNPKKRVMPSSMLQCHSYWKGNLWVALDYCWQLCLFIYLYYSDYFIYIYIYIYMK